MSIMTKAGLDSLKTELKELVVRRADTVEALSEARSQGDLSENAGYHISKAELARIDKKIFQLEEKIASANVVENVKTDEVSFGAYVKVMSEDTNKEMVFRIVSEEEMDNEEEDITFITIKSPVAKALIGKKVGDRAEVETRVGVKHYLVQSIGDHKL